MKKIKFTPEVINSLEKLEGVCPIFVFGSNVQGEHVGGAALFAFQNCGATYRKGFGFQGGSYAIPTCIRLTDKDGIRYTKPFDNVNQIKPYVDLFANDAEQYPNMTFYVTKIGCGIAGFKANEVAELFRPCLYMENVVLPEEFVRYLLYTETIWKASERGLVGGVDYDDETLVDFVMTFYGELSVDEMLDKLVELTTIG